MYLLVSVAFNFKAKPVVKSDIFAFKLILADKFRVSLPIRLLNILAVSDNFNLVNSAESE